ncbi:hypothetical protein [Polaribacter aestuariivivens]
MGNKDIKKKKAKLLDMDGIEIVKAKMLIYEELKEKGSENNKIDFSDYL